MELLELVAPGGGNRPAKTKEWFSSVMDFRKG